MSGLLEQMHKPAKCEIELDEGVPCPNETFDIERCARCNLVVCWSHRVNTFTPLYGSSSVSEESLCPSCASELIEELANEIGELRDDYRMEGRRVIVKKTQLKRGDG